MMTVEEARAALVAAQLREHDEKLRIAEEKRRSKAEKLAAKRAAWIAEENQKLSPMVGRTVKSVLFDASGEGIITITFTDDSTFELSASGDDMTHITFELEGGSI